MTVLHVRAWRRLLPALVLSTASAVCVSAAGQAPAGTADYRPSRAAAPVTPATAAVTPDDYVIGPDDVLSISFWREKDLSADVTVRPDGKVTVPLLNDVMASGRTPDQLRDSIKEMARAFLEDPTPTVVVKEIKSRRVFITGQVEKPGPYPLNDRLTVLQLIAVAGGLKEFADGKNITVLRTFNGRVVTLAFNYRDVIRRKHLDQNVDLRPGDTVVVP